MITTRLASRFGLSMPILLAATDTFSDVRGHRGHPGWRPRLLAAGYVATDPVTHTRAELRESV